MTFSAISESQLVDYSQLAFIGGGVTYGPPFSPFSIGWQAGKDAAQLAVKNGFSLKKSHQETAPDPS